VGNNPSTPQTEACVGPTAGIFVLGTTKILLTTIQALDHPAHEIDAMLTMLTKL
jgi:hypothetical protein